MAPAAPELKAAHVSLLLQRNRTSNHLTRERERTGGAQKNRRRPLDAADLPPPLCLLQDDDHAARGERVAVAVVRTRRGEAHHRGRAVRDACRARSRSPRSRGTNATHPSSRSGRPWARCPAARCCGERGSVSRFTTRGPMASTCSAPISGFARFSTRPVGFLAAERRGGALRAPGERQHAPAAAGNRPACARRNPAAPCRRRVGKPMSLVGSPVRERRQIQRAGGHFVVGRVGILRGGSCRCRRSRTPTPCGRRSSRAAA